MTHRVPAVIVVIPIEGTPWVSRPGNASEWVRLASWIMSQPGLVALLDAAYDAQSREEVEAEDEDEVEDEAPAMIAVLWMTYENFPNLAPQDLAIVTPEVLAEVGIVVNEEGRVESWDEDRFAYDEEALPGFPRFRPSAEWPPSMCEIEDRDE